MPDASAHREILIRVRKVGSIAITFVEAGTGKAISEMDVVCALDAPWEDAPERSRTREDRRMDVARLGGVRPGRHLLYAEMRRYWPPKEHLNPPPVEIEVRPGEETQVEIAFERGRTVKGRVVDEDGHRREAAVYFESTWRGVKQFTQDQTYGRFELTAVPPTKGRLKLIDINTMEERVWEDIALDEDLGELVLPRGQALTGRLPPLTDPEEVYLYVESSDGCVTSGDLVVCDGDEFRIECLRPGTAANIFIIATGRAVFILRDVVLAPGETRSLGVIAFPEGTVVEGRVVSSRGEPVVGAVVGGLDLHAPGTATTDGEGRFRLTRLASLPTTLRVWLDKRPEGFFDVDVREGMPSITLRLPVPGHLRARFRRVSEEPLPVTRVWFIPVSDDGESDDRRYVRLLTDGYGRVEADLPPGTWVPRVFRRGGDNISSTPPEAVIRSGETTEVEIRVR